MKIVYYEGVVNGSSIEIWDNNDDRILARFTPEEAVDFAVRLSNIAWPLTKAVKTRAERHK